MAQATPVIAWRDGLVFMDHTVFRPPDKTKREVDTGGKTLRNAREGEREDKRGGLEAAAAATSFQLVLCDKNLALLLLLLAKEGKEEG